MLHLFDFSTFLYLKGFNLGKKHYVCNQKNVNRGHVNADSFNKNSLGMNNNEKVIQLYISTKNVADKERENHYIVNGIERLEEVNKRLHFNGNEAIYVHLCKPIEYDAVYYLLSLWCKSLVDNGYVHTAKHQRIPMPISGEGYHTTYGDGNKLLEERFMITYV